jgi:hypothetical protein
VERGGCISIDFLEWRSRRGLASSIEMVSGLVSVNYARQSVLERNLEI